MQYIKLKLNYLVISWIRAVHWWCVNIWCSWKPSTIAIGRTNLAWCHTLTLTQLTWNSCIIWIIQTKETIASIFQSVYSFIWKRLHIQCLIVLNANTFTHEHCWITCCYWFNWIWYICCCSCCSTWNYTNISACSKTLSWTQWFTIVF